MENIIIIKKRRLKVRMRVKFFAVPIFIIYSMIIFSFIGLASYPLVDYEVDLDDTLPVGNFSDIGRITFTKDDFYSDVYYLTPELNDINIKQYDYISTENLNFSILINNTLPDNELIRINDLKDRFISEQGNSSNNCTVTVSEPEHNHISLSSNLDFITFSPDEFNFYPSNTLIEIKINSNIPSTLLAGDYDLEIEIEDRNTTRVYTDTITVLPNHEWEVVSINNITNQASNGGFGDYSKIVIKSKGNEVFNLNIQIDGNISRVIALPQSIPIYPSQNSTLDIRFSVPYNLPTGIYTGILTLSSNDKTESYPLSFEVTDLTCPEIRRVSAGNYTAGVETDYEIEVYDNLGIDNATLKIRNMNNSIINDFILDKRSNYIFGKKFVINETGDYYFDVCVSDISGNMICNTTMEKVVPLDVILYKDFIDLGSIKDNEYIGDNLITISTEYNLPFNITIQTAEYSGNFSLRFTTSDGKDYFIHSSENQSSVFFEEDSKIDVAFKGDALAEFSIILNVDTVDYHVPLDNINIKGKIVDYKLPEGQTYKNWFAGEDLVCGVMEGINVESSKWDCEIKYPITMNFEQLPIPFTVEAKKQLENDYQEEIDRLEKANDRLGMIMTITILSLAVMFLVLIYYTRIFPKTRFFYGIRR